MSSLKSFEPDSVARQSRFGSMDLLAEYIARNADAPLSKLARASGLSKESVRRLLTDKEFRERLTELMTFVELNPAKERTVLRRMIATATDEGTKFRDFERAASWVYRQGGMLRAEKANMEVNNALAVSFTLDPSVEGRPEPVDVYEAPDPLAGVVGLPESTPENGHEGAEAREVPSVDRPTRRTVAEEEEGGSPQTGSGGTV